MLAATIGGESYRGGTSSRRTEAKLNPILIDKAMRLARIAKRRHPERRPAPQLFEAGTVSTSRIRFFPDHLDTLLQRETPGPAGQLLFRSQRRVGIGLIG